VEHALGNGFLSTNFQKSRQTPYKSMWATGMWKKVSYLKQFQQLKPSH